MSSDKTVSKEQLDSAYQLAKDIHSFLLYKNADITETTIALEIIIAAQLSTESIKDNLSADHITIISNIAEDIHKLYDLNMAQLRGSNAESIR